MDPLDTLTERYFSEVHATSLATLLAPLDDGGENLSRSELYATIRKAREEDDASLPLGDWERELKRADWPRVGRLCLNGLATRSKDLQLAAWLFEAELHQRGFRALAPCLHLIAALVDAQWPTLYPRDAEHRENLFEWIAEKLRPPLRLVPITATGGDAEYAWADWEQAQRNEQIRAALGKDSKQPIEGATLAQFGAALASTPSTEIVVRQEQLAAAETTLVALAATLDRILGAAAPNLEPLRAQIEDIALLLAGEARRRGLQPQAMTTISGAPAPPAPAPADGDVPAHAAAGGAAPAAIGEAERRRLYQSLTLMAEQLAHLEPHSPVPYLIRRAVAWGGLNTAQLYNEVFVRCGGQINIFELLGLEEQIAASASSES